jgi:hypothetical protein
MNLRRALRRAVVALSVALALLIPIVPIQAQVRASDPNADREILVMLRLAPPHYRPNAGYGGDYGDAVSSTARRRIARRIAQQNRLELVDGWPMPLVGVDCYVMRVPADVTIQTMVAQVSKDPSVVWSEQMGAFQAEGRHSVAF